MIALLLALLGCGGDASREAPADAPPRAPSAACVRWLGPPVRVSPGGDGVTRHHPTVARRGRELLVAWQEGKRTSRVVVGTFDDALAARGPAAPISPDDHDRATHPQVVADDREALLAWTEDTTGTLWVRALGPDGAPVGAPVRVSGEAAALYPDVVLRGDGSALAWWYEAGDAPGYAWALRPTLDGAWDGRRVPMSAGSFRGGAPTVALDPAGAPWLAWSEARRTDTWGAVRIQLARWTAEGAPAPTTIAEGPEHWDRPAVAFVGGAPAVAWTRYGNGREAWGVYLARDGAHAELGAREARMIDLAAVDDALIAAWEERRGRTWEVVALTDRAGERCGPEPIHPGGGDQARANLLTWEDGGVVVWQASDRPGGADAVWGRRFAARR